MVNFLASKRSCKLLPGVGFSSNKVNNRRLMSQLICRLPLLTIWTLIVIFLLYKSISDSSSIDDAQDEKQLQATLRAFNDQQDEQEYSDKIREDKSLNDQPIKSQQLINNHDKSETIVISKFPRTTDKLISHLKQENVRQSKVFILIIQNENLLSTNLIHPSSPSKKSDRYSSSLFAESFASNRKHQRNVIPQHIKILMQILDAHRIEYTIDSTRTGLPTTLLTDNSSEFRQYSVIIIDDFIKYTKLNRWVRDQLDRHCRTNQVGVITYLISSGLEDVTTIYNKAYLSSHSVSRRHGQSTTEESLADQFPLIFKSIETKNLHQNSSTPYLVDYQLNQKSQILRILKRRKNFIIHGPLSTSINQLPWVSMSSEHVTYEPLTWARINLKQANENMVKNPKSLVSSINTREMNHFDSSLKDNTEMGGNSLSDSESENIYGPSLDISSEFGDSLQEYDIHNNDYKNSNASSHDTSSSKEFNSTSNHEDINNRLVLSMFDRGLYDGIKRVIFGGTNHHWLNRILLLDAVEHLSSGKILSSLTRFIQIDIDDIFVGEKGKRMSAKDVEALLATQRKFAQRIEGGFKFNLGFSGKYYKHGHEEENIGDEQLVANANEFTWFCHTWSHSKAHLSNETEAIATELKRNLKFAREHKLPIVGQAELVRDSKESLQPTYAVAPHHSGVYPVHEQLYDAWKSVLNVQVTSTEEYPHLRPASGRRGFVHKAIKVLPRQTCGLYSHTIYKHKYPGGIRKLDSIVRGGELFETVLHNPVNIYMTHMSNYANDRLALYTFSELLEFVEMNTNLQLKYASSSQAINDAPLKLADYYFDLYSDEKQPLWTNPCSDKRHLSIWGLQKRTKYCQNIPQLLIVGPQKTGTTALYTFLKMNPIFKSSLISAPDYEEIQFFNDKYYHKGVDWYLNKFSTLETENNSGNNSEIVAEAENYCFDKSATYFDDPKVAQRAANLLPAARIVILLINPADRAYSWYQHIRAHGDQVANSLTFEQIIMYNNEDELTHDSSNNYSSSIKSLKDRCLHPGYYSQHLNRWLEFYPSKQIIIIDGQWFKHNPASVMNRLQLLLHVSQTLDYNQLLVYNEEKGFYCQLKQSTAIESNDKMLMKKLVNNQHSEKQIVDCLGKSKGRKYPPMSEKARNYLNRHYWPHNRHLAQILSDIGQPLPTWLDETMTLANVRSVI